MGKKIQFLLRFSELAKNPLLSFWLINVACDLNGTPAGCLMTKQTHLNFCYLWDFFNMIICCTPLDIKPHPSPGGDSLPPQPTDAIYVALLLFILISEWLNGFVVSPKKLWSYIVWNLQAQVIIFLEEIFTGSSLKLHEKVGRTLDKVVLLDLLTLKFYFHTDCDPVHLEGRLSSPPRPHPPSSQKQCLFFPPTPSISESRYAYQGMWIELDRLYTCPCLKNCY